MNKKLITYLLADDDPLYRELTLQQLAFIPDLFCVGQCENAFLASSMLREKTPDMLILDIEMPGLSGLQLARSLKQLPYIIFISSHSHYAAEAFDVDAIDYLVKPIVPERLLRAIDKVRQLMELKRSTPANDGFKASDETSFFIKEKGVFTKILHDDILYIEALADFVHIFLNNGTKKIALVNLKNLEQQLPANHFIRISRTHIINKQKITSIESSSISLDKINLQVGKSFSESVLQSVVGNTFIKRHI